MRSFGTLILAVLLVGCSGISGSPKGQVEAAPPTHPIEQVHLGNTMADVKAIFGEPTTTKSETTLSTSDRWTYEQLGFSVQFVDGKLITASQWKGNISNGLAIGDSKLKVSELGISVEPGIGVEAVGYLDQEVGRIEILIDGDRVIRFVYGPGSESDL